MPIDEPYDATWIISVRGRTQGDGEVYTVTAQIIRDKLQYMLDRLLAEGKIKEYSLSATRNNIAEEEQQSKKSNKKEYKTA